MARAGEAWRLRQAHNDLARHLEVLRQIAADHRANDANDDPYREGEPPEPPWLMADAEGDDMDKQKPKPKTECQKRVAGI